jgi:hypothetical protein
MADYDRLLDGAKRFMENEIRVNDFVNGNESGFYVTNLDPPRQVETIPRFLERFAERYHTLRFRGDWEPGTAYAQNDVVREPGSESFWVVPEPHVSGGTFADDVGDRKIVPYQNELIPDGTNLRATMVALNDTEAGSEVDLPVAYYPGRNSLLVFYYGIMCVPKSAVGGDPPDANRYQYEESGADQNTPSQKITIHFGVRAGEALDLIVLSTALSRDVSKLEAMIKGIADDVSAAAGSASTAASEAGKAAQSASAAASSESTATSKAGAAAQSASEAAASAGDAADEAGKAAQSASAAASSESTATSKAGAAAESASTASTKASAAAESASTASTKAGDASTSAATATTKAGAAAQSALDAAGSASAAEDSADAAEAALAELNAAVSDALNAALDSSDKALYLKNGKIASQLTLAHAADTGTLSLLGKTGSDSKPVVISSVNLPVDRYLKEAAVVVDPDGEPAGHYLELVFITEDGESTVYVDLSDLAGSNLYSKVQKSSHKVTAAIASGANFTLDYPYAVGTDSLDVFVDGLYLEGGSEDSDNYQEVGTAGAQSTTIKFKFTVPVGSLISYKIIS